MYTAYGKLMFSLGWNSQKKEKKTGVWLSTYGENVVRMLTKYILVEFISW